MWFTEAYIKHIFIKLVLKIFTLRIQRENVKIYCLNPEYEALVYCSGRLVSHLATSAIAEKKINGEVDENI